MHESWREGRAPLLLLVQAIALAVNIDGHETLDRRIENRRDSDGRGSTPFHGRLS